MDNNKHNKKNKKNKKVYKINVRKIKRFIFKKRIIKLLKLIK